MESYAPPGVAIETFSSDESSPDLVGQKISATLTLTGRMAGVRWWISKIRVVP